MKKVMVGVRLRRLREDRRLTQASLAGQLGISPSYLNQLENNQRPLTTPVLLRLSDIFGADLQWLSEGDEARLITDLREAFADPAEEAVSLSEIREIASAMPALGRRIIALSRRHRQAVESADAVAASLGLGTPGAAPLPTLMPYEHVRDFFYRNHNYFEGLDRHAEGLSSELGLEAGTAVAVLTRRLADRHGVSVVVGGEGTGANRRAFDPAGKQVRIAARLDAGQQAFQLATQLALLEARGLIEDLAQQAGDGSATTEALTRVGLANYYAGALLMPYEAFRVAAEGDRYDIDRLMHRYGLGYETICHRLSSLQRPGAVGVPFFFIRVDRAGNISKRQSATDFHFSRVGGACPLWNVYEAFSRPGDTLTQIAQMPDGRTYLWVSRALSRPAEEYGAPGRAFAVALGCDIRHAGRLVYSRGLDLGDLSAATPIGAGCKVCERPACPQRAFPNIGRAVRADEHQSGFTPYV